MRDSPKKSHLQIRKSMFHDLEGFSIIGIGPNYRGVRIFTRTRFSAEWIRAKKEQRQEITVADFHVGDDGLTNSPEN